MAHDENPRDRIPGTRSRFRYPFSDTGYAFIGPAIVLVLAILIGLYAVGGWIGDNDGVQRSQPGAVVPKAPSQAPSNSK